MVRAASRYVHVLKIVVDDVLAKSLPRCQKLLDGEYEMWRPEVVLAMTRELVPKLYAQSGRGGWMEVAQRCAKSLITKYEYYSERKRRTYLRTVTLFPVAS